MCVPRLVELGSLQLITAYISCWAEQQILVRSPPINCTVFER